MAAGAASRKLALALSGLWLLTFSLSLLAALGMLAAAQNWHAIRGPLQQLSLWQSWISIAACVGLLVASRQRYGDSPQAWAQGALPAYVLGGLLTVLILHYGVLTKFLAQHGSLLHQMQMLVLLSLHWLCALLTLRSLCTSRQPG